MSVEGLLPAKRGERGLTIHQVVASATRIRAEHLAALEAATFIAIDGHALRGLGAGVATREFSSQTSP